MNDDIQLEAQNLSKKFAKSLKRAMVYGMADIGRASFGGNHGWEDNDVQLRKDEFWALRDVTFQVKKGERVGIIGSNGAGKSTLFSVLSGIYGPSTGRVEIRGRLQALIELGAGFHPMLTGRENIQINAAILGMKKRELEKHLHHIIEFAEIGDFIDAPVKNYSSGMLVRLGFAVAVNMNPDVMLIDEVLAVGDAQFQSKCVGFTQRLADEGKTLIMVSHQLPQVLRVCERVIWMRHGQIVMDGDANDVVRHYSADSMQRLHRAKQDEALDTGLVVSEGIEFRYRIIGSDHPEVDSMRGDEFEGLPMLMQGDTLTIEVEYELKTKISGKLSFWVHVKDAHSGTRLFGSGGWYAEALIEAQPGSQGTFRIEFPDCPLLEGLFNLDLGVTDHTRAGESHGIAVHKETKPTFIVVSSREGFWEPFHVVEGARLPLISTPVNWKL